MTFNVVNCFEMVHRYFSWHTHRSGTLINERGGRSTTGRILWRIIRAFANLSVNTKRARVDNETTFVKLALRIISIFLHSILIELFLKSIKNSRTLRKRARTLNNYIEILKIGCQLHRGNETSPHIRAHSSYVPDSRG